MYRHLITNTVFNVSVNLEGEISNPNPILFGINSLREIKILVVIGELNNDPLSLEDNDQYFLLRSFW